MSQTFSIREAIATAPTLLDLLELWQQVKADPAFAGATDDTWRKWRRTVLRTLVVFVLECETVAEVTFVINATFTRHQWDGSDEERQVLRNIARQQVERLAPGSIHVFA